MSGRQAGRRFVLVWLNRAILKLLSSVIDVSNAALPLQRIPQPDARVIIESLG